MRTFKDADGREWRVAIDVFQLRAVRDRCDFELGKLSLDEFRRLDQLADDFLLLVDVLAVLVADQLKGKGVGEDEFKRAMVGDPLGEAFEALLDAYLLFYPSRRAKPYRALAAELAQLAAEKERERAAGPTGTTPASGSAESSASTPTPAA